MPKKIFERSKCKGNLIARYVHRFGFLVKIKPQELNNLTCPSYSNGCVQLLTGSPPRELPVAGAVAGASVTSSVYGGGGGRVWDRIMRS